MNWPGARGAPPGCLGPRARPVPVRPRIGRPQGGVGWPWGPRRGGGAPRPGSGRARGDQRGGWGGGGGGGGAAGGGGGDGGGGGPVGGRRGGPPAGQEDPGPRLAMRGRGGDPRSTVVSWATTAR